MKQRSIQRKGLQKQTEPNEQYKASISTLLMNSHSKSKAGNSFQTVISFQQSAADDGVP